MSSLLPDAGAQGAVIALIRALDQRSPAAARRSALRAAIVDRCAADLGLGDTDRRVCLATTLLAEIARPLPVCADESCHDRASLPALRGKYDMVNIKLDKTGGLTESLKLAATARKAGLQIMVGCMISTSLAMAPAVLVAQGAVVVDLDGPLLLARDREPGLTYRAAEVLPADPALWG